MTRTELAIVTVGVATLAVLADLLRRLGPRRHRRGVLRGRAGRRRAPPARPGRVRLGVVGAVVSAVTIEHGPERHRVDVIHAAVLRGNELAELDIVVVPATYGDPSGRTVGSGVALASASDPSTPLLLLDTVGARTLLGELLRHVGVGSPS